jgi:hypothetical protein
VPVSVSDDQATAMYNSINGASLPTILWMEKPVEVPKPKADKGDVPDADAAAAAAQRDAPQGVVVHRNKKP